MTTQRLSTCAMAAMTLMAVGLSGSAAETRDWKFEVTPYVWLAGLEGDVTVNGREVEFEKSASDLFESTEAALSLFGTFQYQRFLVWGQVDYFQNSTDQLDVEDRPQGGELDTKMLLGEVAVGYQLDGWAKGQTFDVLVGARHISMRNTLNVYGSGEVERENDLVDPMLVLRPSIPVFPSKIEGLRLNPTFAIGGGNDADLIYELFPEFQYQISQYVSARLGYRTVGFKFKGENNEDNELNVRLAGLVAGVGFTF